MDKKYELMLPILSARLESIIKMVNRGERIIDVGTDHALIPIKIIGLGLRKSAVASDIREGPLKIAQKNIDKYGLQKKIKIFQSDGLKYLVIEPDDCIVIAGMGGYEIISILKDAMPPCKNIILQPQKSLMELRCFLSENGYLIDDEIIVKENNRFYIVMKIEYTGRPYSLNLTMQIAGPVILKKKSEHFYDYISYLINQMGKKQKGNKNYILVKSELEKELIDFDYKRNSKEN